MNIFYKNKKLEGFLIMEVLIASFVLTVGLTATMALIAESLKNSFDSRDTIIAVELAQEGVELVRNVRDNGFIGDPTNPFSASFDNGKKHCRIAYDDSSLGCQGLSSAVSYVLQYTAGGFYKYSGGTATKFSRYLYVNYDNTAGQENALVRSFVYWGGADDFSLNDAGSNGNAALCTVAEKCVFTEVTLTNWQSS